MQTPDRRILSYSHSTPVTSRKMCQNSSGSDSPLARHRKTDNGFGEGAEAFASLTGLQALEASTTSSIISLRGDVQVSQQLGPATISA